MKRIHDDNGDQQENKRRMAQLKIENRCARLIRLCTLNAPAEIILAEVALIAKAADEFIEIRKQS